MKQELGILGAVVYRPGYSFRNAPLARPATIVRKNPWFYQKMTGGPLTKRAKLRRWKGGKMARYRAVWNRGSRQAVANKIALALNDMPDYNDVGLGQAPGPTDKVNSTDRGPLGFLQNILSAGVIGAEKYAELKMKREQERTKLALAQLRVYQEATEPQYAGAGMFGGLNIGILGAAGVAAVVLLSMTQRKK